MQTFSYMQRNIDDKKNIIYILIFTISIFYESLTTIYPFLPPLLGIAFWFFLKALNFNNRLLFFLITIYTIFFEVDHSLPLFSTIFLYLLLYLIFKRFFKLFSNITILKVMAVSSVYIFYPIVLYIFHKFFKTDIFSIDFSYLSYIFLEIFILLIVG